MIILWIPGCSCQVTCRHSRQPGQLAAQTRPALQQKPTRRLPRPAWRTEGAAGHSRKPREARVFGEAGRRKHRETRRLVNVRARKHCETRCFATAACRKPRETRRLANLRCRKHRVSRRICARRALGTHGVVCAGPASSAAGASGASRRPTTRRSGPGAAANLAKRRVLRRRRAESIAKRGVWQTCVPE